ncbi:MAG: MaoC family dehydratase [Candidatus Omnitrophota bacterium]
MKKYSFEDIKVGMSRSLQFNVTDKLVDDFCKLSGDYSDIHCSVDFANKQGFPNRIAHGMLIGAFISRLIGMELPGKFGLLHSMNLKFHKPCFPGDTIKMTGVVLEKIKAVKTIIVGVRVTKKNRILLISGTVQAGVIK